MSTINTLQLTTPVGGQTTYTAPSTDLYRYNSLAYTAFYSHASLSICNLKLYFSTDGEDFTLYKEITLNNDVTSTGNELIPSRFFRFEIENPDLNAMSLINIVFTAHKTATSNIDVNLDETDITISGVATEATLELVKDNLDTIKLNTDKLPRVGGVLYENATVLAKSFTEPIDMGEVEGYNVIQVSGQVPFATSSSYTFLIQFARSVDGPWYSDNIFPDVKRLTDTPYSTFSLTRTNIGHRYIRIYNVVAGSNLYLDYDLLKN